MFSNANKTVIMNLEQSVISALAKLTPDASLPVSGKLVASKDVQAQIQAHVDTMTSVAAARAKVSQLHDLDQSQRAQTSTVITCVRSYAALLFGENSPEFASFGFTPKKVAQRTLESKTEGAEKALATRAARHTMGKRQKAGIHGVVATVPPANAPAAASPVTTAPAANSPPAADAGANGAVPTTALVNGTTH